MKHLSLSDIREILSSTVKYDETNKVIIFIVSLLTYTEEDQINLGLSGESSSGKTYLILEIAAYFPELDVLSTGYCSPTAFFHDFGLWDEMKRETIIDFSHRILIFLDQPHTQLLEKLRSVLSHDKKVIMVKITDRDKRKLRTKNVKLIGYPTVAFCTTKASIAEEEKTRMILLSPEIAQEKIKASLRLLAEKLKNREAFKEFLRGQPERRLLMERVEDIKKEGIRQIIIKDEDMQFILDKFLNDRNRLVPSHQRDFPRMIALIKGVALLNFHEKERLNPYTIVATREDVEEGYHLYSEVSKANELGISPEVYDIYEKVLKAKSDNDLTKKDISREYFCVFQKPIGSKKLDMVLEALLSVGLIQEFYDSVDRRLKRYSLSEYHEKEQKKSDNGGGLKRWDSKEVI